MAASPAPSMRRSWGSSASKRSAAPDRRHEDQTDQDEASDAPSMPIDTLVNHLLAAKRSLSSVTLVLRANHLATAAQHAHEDAAVLSAQADFVKASILDQAALLVRVRRSLQVTYDWGRRDFKKLVRAMDDVDGQLGDTMKMLRNTEVQTGPSASEAAAATERKNLMDYVDEGSVHGMIEAMKKSIADLQSIQQSYDGDLLRFDTDIRTLKRMIVEAPAGEDDEADDDDEEDDEDVPVTELLINMIDHSSSMAQLLTSLTKHFDLCVTAVRTTEGAAALARRKAAETTKLASSESVSISGVIAEQESNDESDLEPKTASDRAEMLKVVVQDAGEVDDVVQEIQERLAAVEHDYAALERRSRSTRRRYHATLDAYAALEDVGDRLADYVAAEGDFRARWDLEREAVFDKLREMGEMRDFYEGYASAYGSLLLEAERRRGVDDKVRGTWRKAAEAVDKVLEADRAARETFRLEVGEFLPTDLWAGMQTPASRFEVVEVPDEGDDARE